MSLMPISSRSHLFASRRSMWGRILSNFPDGEEWKAFPRGGLVGGDTLHRETCLLVSIIDFIASIDFWV